MSSNLVFRFSANKYPFSVLIRAATWSDYSHIDLVLDKGLYFGALPFDGVCKHNETHSTEDYFELVLPDNGDGSSIKTQLDIRRWILSQEGKPYDWTGIFGFATHRDWEEPDSWFCSELMASGINRYFNLFNEEPHRISPRDLAINGVFKKITPADCNLLG